MNSKSIHFSIATPKHILKQSVVEVSSTSLYRVKQRIPVDNGVLSLRMGSLDRRLPSHPRRVGSALGTSALGSCRGRVITPEF